MFPFDIRNNLCPEHNIKCICCTYSLRLSGLTFYHRSKDWRNVDENVRYESRRLLTLRRVRVWGFFCRWTDHFFIRNIALIADIGARSPVANVRGQFLIFLAVFLLHGGKTGIVMQRRISVIFDFVFVVVIKHTNYRRDPILSPNIPFSTLSTRWNFRRILTYFELLLATWCARVRLFVFFSTKIL